MPAVLMITDILLGISTEDKIFFNFFLSSISPIFLDMPSLFILFGMRTQYLPANERYVVKAAPLRPLSSLFI